MTCQLTGLQAADCSHHTYILIHLFYFNAFSTEAETVSEKIKPKSIATQATYQEILIASDQCESLK
jgi:hypothetical protein